MGQGRVMRMMVGGVARLFMSSLEKLDFSLEKQNLRGDRIALHVYMERWKGREKKKCSYLS